MRTSSELGARLAEGAVASFAILWRALESCFALRRMARFHV